MGAARAGLTHGDVDLHRHGCCDGRPCLEPDTVKAAFCADQRADGMGHRRDVLDRKCRVSCRGRRMVPVVEARDAAIARGIVINGLPLMTRKGLGAPWDIKDLDQYYLNCVVGGPGAFVVPVYQWDYFPQAVRRK